jgi:glycerate 2-kinase
MAKEKQMRRDAAAIFRASLRAADPYEAVLRQVTVTDGVMKIGRQSYRLDRYRRIYVIGAGKASAVMARAVEKLLGKRIAGGLVNVKYEHVAPLRRVELNECGHPVPDTAGEKGASRIAEIAAAADSSDLVICLLSGGGSALMPAPAGGVTLEEKQQTTRLMLACGANIHEMNAVRKHLSAMKGGQLARLASPAAVLSLILSDVIGDDLDVIASGPTAPDRSSFEDACSILERYQLWKQLPEAVRARLGAGARGEVLETPKPGDALFAKVQNVIVGSNRLAVDAAAAEAKRLGWRPLVLSTLIEGETRDVARMHAAIVKEVRLSGRPTRPPVCLISGGETTVTLRGQGKGGRNQEFALAAAVDLAGLDNVVVLSGGTDGTDGPTDAAGAIADGRTLERASAAGMNALDVLARNDSYHFFAPLNDLLMTGPTGTNVMDVRLLLVG